MHTVTRLVAAASEPPLLLLLHPVLPLPPLLGAFVGIAVSFQSHGMSGANVFYVCCAASTAVLHSFYSTALHLHKA
jgi:hypothetical protein